MGENPANYTLFRRLVTRIYKEPNKLSNKKPNNSTIC